MKKIILLAAVLVLLFIGFSGISFASDTETAKLYELYSSTSTTDKHRPILKRLIAREERTEELRAKVAGGRALAAPTVVKGVGNSSAAPLAADPAFKLGEVYCYPNPAKRTNPTFHIETGLADTVELKIYDVSGGLVHEAALPGPPQQIDDGQGPQLAYEYLWDTKNAGSGVYIFSIISSQGDKTLKKTGRCAVVK